MDRFAALASPACSRSPDCDDGCVRQVGRGGHRHPGGEGEVCGDQGAAAGAARVPAHQLQILLPLRQTGGRPQVHLVTAGEGNTLVLQKVPSEGS